MTPPGLPHSPEDEYSQVDNMSVLVDGKEMKPAEQMAYKAMMVGDVPNLAFAVGYTNASWTLKVDLTCEYVTRVLRHMSEHGHDICRPVLDPSVMVMDRAMT